MIGNLKRNGSVKKKRFDEKQFSPPESKDLFEETEDIADQYTNNE